MNLKYIPKTPIVWPCLLFLLHPIFNIWFKIRALSFSYCTMQFLQKNPFSILNKCCIGCNHSTKHWHWAWKMNHYCRRKTIYVPAHIPIGIAFLNMKSCNDMLAIMNQIDDIVAAINLMLYIYPWCITEMLV